MPAADRRHSFLKRVSIDLPRASPSWVFDKSVAVRLADDCRVFVVSTHPRHFGSKYFCDNLGTGHSCSPRKAVYVKNNCGRSPRSVSLLPHLTLQFRDCFYARRHPARERALNRALMCSIVHSVFPSTCDRVIGWQSSGSMNSRTKEWIVQSGSPSANNIKSGRQNEPSSRRSTNISRENWFFFRRSYAAHNNDEDRF